MCDQDEKGSAPPHILQASLEPFQVPGAKSLSGRLKLGSISGQG